MSRTADTYVASGDSSYPFFVSWSSQQRLDSFGFFFQRVPLCVGTTFIVKESGNFGDLLNTINSYISKKIERPPLAATTFWCSSIFVSFHVRWIAGVCSGGSVWYTVIRCKRGNLYAVSSTSFFVNKGTHAAEMIG